MSCSECCKECEIKSRTDKLGTCKVMNGDCVLNLTSAAKINVVKEQNWLSVGSAL